MKDPQIPLPKNLTPGFHWMQRQEGLLFTDAPAGGQQHQLAERAGLLAYKLFIGAEGVHKQRLSNRLSIGYFKQECRLPGGVLGADNSWKGVWLTVRGKAYRSQAVTGRQESS